MKGAFDEARLNALAEELGEDDLRELVAEFGAQLHLWLHALRQLSVDADKLMREVAHAIRSSAAMIGAAPLEQAARALELHVGGDVQALRDDVLARGDETERDVITRFR